MIKHLFKSNTNNYTGNVWLDRKNVSARLLKTILVILIGSLTIYLIVREIQEFRIGQPEIILLSIVAILVLCYIVLVQGYFNASAILTITVTFSGMTIIAMTSMGVRDGAVLTYLIIIYFSALLLGKVASLVTALASIIAVWIMVYLENRGLLVYDPWSIEMIARDVTATLIAIYTLSVFYDNTLNKYIKDINMSRSDYKRVNEELIERNIELKEAIKKAEESDRLKTSFLANLSHEIRTPMNGIIGFSELVVSSQTTPEVKDQYNTIIAKSCKQLLGVVNDIVDISKIESGVLDVNMYPVNLNFMLQELYDLHALSAKNKNIEFEFETGMQDDESTILTDEVKVKAVLDNLLTNALKFTEKGFVKFGYVRKKENLEFYISDSGVGISLEQQAKVFDRFIQEDSGMTRKYGGTGLGLSIAKAYIEKLGGKIWISSKEDKGSKFIFTIPFEKKRSTSLHSEGDHVEVESKKLNVLVVEDIEYNEILLKKMLLKYNFDLVFAKTGEEALEIFDRNNSFDLIFMDIKLPGIDGYEVTRRIRKKNQDIPIIAQTAYAFSEDKKMALESGCNTLLSKPITTKSLKFALGEVNL
jgi:signal transduction histidine kinase